MINSLIDGWHQLTFKELFSGCGWGGWGMHGGRAFPYHFNFGGIFVWIILLGIVGFLVYLFINRNCQDIDFGSNKETPIEILKKRYARGEISKEEFDKMKEDLKD